MIKKNILLLFLLAFAIFSSCSYHFVDSNKAGKLSVSVPYIEGDREGSLTAILIEELQKSPRLSFERHLADYELKIKLLDSREENVGFRYDREQDGSVAKSLLPSTSRRATLFELALVDRRTGEILYETIKPASVEFDYDVDGERENLREFSLGQLNMVDTARDSSEINLNRSIAREIVDFINLQIW